MIKKLIKFVLSTGLFLSIGGCFCLGNLYFGIGNGGTFEEDFPFIDDSRVEDPECDSTTLGDCVVIKDEGKQSIINRLLTVFGLNNDALGGDHKFLAYAKAILNMALGLISFIALLITIYTFYMMLFSENEAGIKKARGTLVGIFITLAVIGLARLIVSFIFWRYQKNRKEQQENITRGQAVAMFTTDKNQIYLNI